MEATAAAERLIRAGRMLDARGWCPATSGNYSVRLDAQSLLVTASGKHKGHLTAEDFVVVDLDGRPLAPTSGGADGRSGSFGRGKPSAETPLHALMFRLDPRIGAVLHTHSVASTVLGRALQGQTSIELEGYEMQKAFGGVTTHEERLSIPIVDNSQDVPALAREVAQRWQRAHFPGYVLRGHGLYAWDADVDGALRAIEALEFLVACELERRKLGS